jgi:hypothetical protein
LNEVTPPKPKKKPKRQKAKQSAKEILARKRKKVAQAEQTLRSAKIAAENTKRKLLTINKALEGKDTQLLTEDIIDSAPKTIQEHVKSQDVIFKPNGGPQTQFLPGAKWREQEKEWRFPSGAKIEFGYAENMTDVLRYQGQSYTWIGIDELPQYPSPDIYNFLRSSLRSVDKDIPVYLRATGNPGNIGSQWVKEMFVDPAEPNSAFEIKIDTPVGVKTITRRFIPAKLQDNPYLMQTDDYYAMLASLPDIQRKQFLDGDWDAYEDSAFPEFSKTTHVVEPFEIPKGWYKFRAADWGYSSPACVLWFAVDYNNNLWLYRELYTSKVTADIFARQVLELESGEYIQYGVLDSSTWAKRGDVGPSIAETMIQQGCRWRQSDRSPKSRISGKLEIHKRLLVNDKEPGLRVFKNCRNLIRTMSTLPTDKKNPEDVDTNAEDHAYDALRYGCMSRPMHPKYAQRFKPLFTPEFKPADNKFGY